MVAAEQNLSPENSEHVTLCRECRGAGIVSYWSEIAYFEDRRACVQCEAGCGIDSKIGDIVRRAQLEERLAGR